MTTPIWRGPIPVEPPRTRKCMAVTAEIHPEPSAPKEVPEEEDKAKEKETDLVTVPVPATDNVKRTVAVVTMSKRVTFDPSLALVEAMETGLEELSALATGLVDHLTDPLVTTPRQETLEFARSEMKTISTIMYRARRAARALKMRTRGAMVGAETQTETPMTTTESPAEIVNESDPAIGGVPDANTTSKICGVILEQPAHPADKLLQENETEEKKTKKHLKRPFADQAQPDEPKTPKQEKLAKETAYIRPPTPEFDEMPQETPSLLPAFGTGDVYTDHYDVAVHKNLLAILRLEAAFRERTGDAGAKLMLLLKRKALRWLKSDHDTRHIPYPTLCRIVLHAVGGAMIPSEDEERVRRLLVDPEVTRMRETHADFCRDMTNRHHGIYCKLRSKIMRKIGPLPEPLMVFYGSSIG